MSNNSIPKSFFRAFLVTIAVVMGLFVGLVPGAMILGLATVDNVDIPNRTEAEVLPNLAGKREALGDSNPVILQIDVTGTIGIGGPEGVTARTIQDILLESRLGLFDEGTVKGIIVVINSPGGTVTDSDAIYRMVKEYKERYDIPVYAFVDGLCASGGMYIAAACDKVYASEVSLIGSIGVVFSPFINVTGLLEKAGIKALTVSVGAEKDLMNPLRPWEDGEEESFRKIANHYYLQFVEIVTSNRPSLDRDKLLYEYGARVYPARQAAELGYIDAAGYDIAAVTAEILSEAGIAGSDYRIISLRPKLTWKNLLRGELDMLSGRVRHQVEIAGHPPELMNKFLYMYRP